MDSKPQVWAGIECTINRVGPLYFDQCERSGHSRRAADLDLFSELGVERLRYPCLWERAEQGWSWFDERMGRLASLGLKPIVGLLHHGSGPSYTSLVDPRFPEHFSGYARAYAERYPWVEDYTPINEPLTTARFSCLYGFWYPHLRSDPALVQSIFLQTKATILAMQEIRRVNPAARLIQTEDLGRAQSTLPLAQQCLFENARRWLTFDLLCGKVDRFHPLYGYLTKNGLTQTQLEWLSENACPPNVLGLNHYLLSNRFLDHRIELYPARFHGGNGRQTYADVGAVDTGQAEVPSVQSILEDAWNRYHLPVAVTEVHLHGPREAQLRWFMEIWKAAQTCRKEGMDITAVTAWSLLGTYDWNTLCTRTDGAYESGVYDLRGKGKPRPTALAPMIRTLSRGQDYHHPVADQPGWWKTSRRVLFAPMSGIEFEEAPAGRPLLITDSATNLGRAFARVCRERGLAFSFLDAGEPRTQFQAKQPWAVVITAEGATVDQAEKQGELCDRENQSAYMLAAACRDFGLPLLCFSSHYVFDGNSETPYTESMPVCPLNTYGRFKAAAEEGVLGVYPEALVIRTGALFCPWGESNFVTDALRNLARRSETYVARGMHFTPTYVPDLVHMSLDLLLDGESGILHMANRGETSWADFARHAARSVRLDDSLVIEKPLDDRFWVAARPRRSVLESERMNLLPALDDALARYISQLEVNLNMEASS